MAERAFQYLLQPTVRQAQRLERLLDLQRELYNAALEERRGAWAWEGRTVTKYEQFGELTGLAALRPDLMAFGVCAARGTLTRLDRAFQAFYRRCRAGAKPGFPRFKGKGRFESVEYPDQSGWRLDEPARRLYVLGVGHIKARLHRPLRGQARTCTIRKEGRRFRVTIFCRDVAERPLAPPGERSASTWALPSWSPPPTATTSPTRGTSRPPATGWPRPSRPWPAPRRGQAGAARRFSEWPHITAGCAANASTISTRSPAGWSMSPTSSSTKTSPSQT